MITKDISDDIFWNLERGVSCACGLTSADFFFHAHADNVQKNAFIQKAHGRTCSAEDPLIVKWSKS